MGGGAKKDPARAIVAGAICGAIEAFISYPTEFVKTNMQLFETQGKLSPMQCAKATVKEYGVKGLYRGLSSLLYFSVPKVATRLGGYEFARNALLDEKGKLSGVRTLMAGMFAGVAEAIIAVTPMDTIKTRLIHDQLTRHQNDRRYKGFLHGVRTIIADQGVGGVYKGLTATIIKQGSNQAIRWFVFNETKEKMAAAKGIPVEKLGIQHTILASILAGTASVYGNTPVDVIKTRMQGLEANRYRSVADCALQILRKEGPLAFYKGATARLARVCLDVTVVMVLYEQVNKILDTVW